MRTPLRKTINDAKEKNQDLIRTDRDTPDRLVVGVGKDRQQGCSASAQPRVSSTREITYEA